MNAVIYQLFFPGDPTGVTHFSFEPFQPGACLTGASGDIYRGDAREHWSLRTPRTAVLERDPETSRLDVVWTLRGRERRATAAQALTFAQFGVCGFKHPLRVTRTPTTGAILPDGANYLIATTLGVWTGSGWAETFAEGKVFRPCTNECDEEKERIKNETGVTAFVYYRQPAELSNLIIRGRSE